MKTPHARRSGLYVIVNTKTGGRYFGSAERLGVRRQRHWRDLRVGEHLNAHLQAAWNRDGEQAFEFRVLAVLEKEDLRATEQKLIDRYYGCVGCYNVSRDASAPMRGRKQSRETVELIRSKITGLKRSPESRARLAAANKEKGVSKKCREAALAKLRGRKLTPEHKEKIAAWRRGRRQKAETVEKRAAKLRGRKDRPEVVEANRQRALAWWQSHPEARETVAEMRRRSEVSKRTRQKMSKVHTGRTHTPETKAKCAAIKAAWWAARKTQEKT